ncbi:hypothetical protein BpHYR1_007950 [Brachionus plicatilis]|uniref:Uncharacterized protein n=1 Tax=Brachionus plicatilis TaxID=10195 RepID=A0A3M7SLY5_BRAPC|nr:hypothetical protein BpHYR1_007950 [Brachionus plicatilis]
MSFISSIEFNYLSSQKFKLKGEAACGPDLIHNLILQEESSMFNLRIYGNRIESLKEIKFLVFIYFLRALARLFLIIIIKFLGLVSFV